MLSATVNPPSVPFEDSLKVNPFDPLGQFVGDRLERALEVEVEAERFLMDRHDLRGEVLRFDDRARGGHNHLLDQMFEFADVAGPVVAGHPRERLAGDGFQRELPLAQPVEGSG